MKNRTFLLPLALGALLTASLFTYSRSETTVQSPNTTTTSQWSVDGACLATIILSVVLFIVGRRVSRAVSAASRRAGLPEALSIPIPVRLVIAAAVPFFLFGWSSTSSESSVETTFGFGVSPYKGTVILLVFLFVWLLALLQRLRALSEHITPQSNSNATGDG